MRRLTILATLLALALSLVACGGGDDDGEEKSAAPQGPSKQEDIGAIEQVLLAYGAAEGTDVCSYYAESQIEAVGGVAGCESSNADTASALFKVENVAVNGDKATAIVSVEGQEGELSTYELSREAGEWKISSFPSDDDPGTTTEEEPAPEPEPVEEPEPLPPATPRVIVDDLLKDFGQAEGTAICDFFSTSFIASLGGRAGCEDTFGDLSFGFQPVGLSFTNGQTRAIALLRNEEGRGSVEAKVTEPIDSLYGGWRITKFVPQRSG